MQIESLTNELAIERASDLVILDSSQGDDYWHEENFVSQLPGKWDLSILASDEAGKLLGFAIASRPDPRRAHLHRIVIAKAYRGKGHGRQLLEELKRRARKMGLRQLSLKVANDNAYAKRLYSSMNFTVDDDSQPYHWMRLPLAENLIVACHQPNFLPWCGYYSKLVHCDVFVILDDVQMPQGRSYVSRTRVADQPDGRWLTVPVSRKSGQKIVEVELAQDSKWRSKHLSLLEQVYSNAPFRDDLLELMSAVYGAEHAHLSMLNTHLLEQVMKYLGIHRKLFRSSSMNIESTSDQRLIDLVKCVGGDTYLSGKGGQNYQDPVKFEKDGINLTVREYHPVEYAQGGANFIPGLSIVDLVAWRGRDVFDVLRYGAA